MSNNYGTIREYRDDPDHRDYRDSDDHASVSDISEQIRSNIFKINNGANTVERAMKTIGTDRDSSELRDKIHETSQGTNKIIQSTMRLMKNASGKRANKQQKMQLDLLKSNFQEAVQRFQRLQKTAADKVKSTVKLGGQKRDAPLVDLENDFNNDRQHLIEEEQRQAQLLQEQEVVIEDDLSLIREREERIHQLESDILDVNEMFRDIGALVHAQGEVLDTIDSNVELAGANVESGNEQLVKASEYQRKSRKKMCCLLVIFLVVACIVTLIIVVTLKT